MSARDLWRRLCAAAGGRWHIPDEADMLRLARLVGERTAERDAAYEAISREVAARVQAEAALGILRAVLAEAEGDVDRLTRERDSWRLRARHQPDDDEAARHAEVELRGGR